MSKLFTTRQAARKLGITAAALSRYVSSGKVPPPNILEIGTIKVHSWTEQDIERLRELLPKIANGRKTWRQKRRLEKQQPTGKAQESAKPKRKNKKKSKRPARTKRLG